MWIWRHTSARNCFMVAAWDIQPIAACFSRKIFIGLRLVITKAGNVQSWELEVNARKLYENTWEREFHLHRMKRGRSYLVYRAFGSWIWHVLTNSSGCRNAAAGDYRLNSFIQSGMPYINIIARTGDAKRWTNTGITKVLALLVQPRCSALNQQYDVVDNGMIAEFSVIYVDTGTISVKTATSFGRNLWQWQTCCI